MSKSKWWPAWVFACAAGCLLAAGPLAAGEKAKAAPEKDKPEIEYVEEETPEEPTKPPIKRRNEPPPPDSVPGFLKLSNDDRIAGHIHLTRDAVLKFHHTSEKKLLHIRLSELTHIEQRVLTERMEKEWRWLENANDEKVYTGRTYPMRELQTVLHMKDGRTLEGMMTALLFVDNENGRQRFVLHRRQKGKPGTKLSDLLYVRLVDFRPPEKKETKQEDPPEDE